jgi:hypothetical protein
VKRKRYQQLLLDAADLIERTGWTKHWYARDKDGNQVPLLSPYACLFCAWGAMHRVSPSELVLILAKKKMAAAVEAAHGTQWWVVWQDGLPDKGGKETVIAMLRKAATT